MIETILSSTEIASAILATMQGVRDVVTAFVKLSSRVNHVANDDEGCSTPVEVSPAQNPLFPS
jgi:hypothetical protein